MQFLNSKQCHQNSVGSGVRKCLNGTGYWNVITLVSQVSLCIPCYVLYTVWSWWDNVWLYAMIVGSMLACSNELDFTFSLWHSTAQHEIWEQSVMTLGCLWPPCCVEKNVKMLFLSGTLGPSDWDCLVSTLCAQIVCRILFLLQFNLQKIS